MVESERHKSNSDRNLPSADELAATFDPEYRLGDKQLPSDDPLPVRVAGAVSEVIVKLAGFSRRRRYRNPNDLQDEITPGERHFT